ncbi:hypothetical protein RvVAT039_02490 [Agrobacterium vitis]|uniref:Lar family restriction alleviation protein n=1 Tax=Agrobacterium vitis TaxID=373 RepID=UPI0015DB02BF|nr:Lar family restriction alleviation protein [Agrobacterium vitis]BCH63033.1 hypothetical protein RvVAT039_02490 [Agrobacterium vitis]
MTETLLPCPFCGDKAQIEKWHGGQPDRHMISCWNTDCDHDPRVIAETRAEAVQKWNRRAMIVLECGGEAKPVYVAEIEAAPSTALKVLGVVQVCPLCDIAGCHHLRTAKQDAPESAEEVASIVAERDALITAGLKCCNGTPNPDLRPFDLAMSFIDSTNTARKAADTLWQQYKAEIEALRIAASADAALLEEAMRALQSTKDDLEIRSRHSGIDLSHGVFRRMCAALEKIKARISG